MLSKIFRILLLKLDDDRKPGIQAELFHLGVDSDNFLYHDARFIDVNIVQPAEVGLDGKLIIHIHRITDLQRRIDALQALFGQFWIVFQEFWKEHGPNTRIAIFGIIMLADQNVRFLQWEAQVNNLTVASQLNHHRDVGHGFQRNTGDRGLLFKNVIINGKHK